MSSTEMWARYLWHSVFHFIEIRIINEEALDLQDFILFLLSVNPLRPYLLFYCISSHLKHS